MKAVREDMHQEAADELVCIKTHDIHTIAALDPVVFPSEEYSVGISADEALVLDRDTVCVAAEIVQHLLGSAKRWFGIHHPFGFAERGQPVCKCTGLSQPF